MNTQISPTLLAAFDTLLSAYKTHTRAAEALRMTARHYRKIRRGDVNIPNSTADLIILKAMTAAQGAPAPATVESVSQPQQVVTG